MQVLFSEARVLGLGPRFMSIYVQKLGVSTLSDPPVIFRVFISFSCLSFAYL